MRRVWYIALAGLLVVTGSLSLYLNGTSEPALPPLPTAPAPAELPLPPAAPADVPPAPEPAPEPAPVPAPAEPQPAEPSAGAPGMPMLDPKPMLDPTPAIDRTTQAAPAPGNAATAPGGLPALAPVQ